MSFFRSIVMKNSSFVQKCNCVKKKESMLMRFAGNISEIKEMRIMKFLMNYENKDESWYKNARNRDWKYIFTIIGGSSLIGGGIGMFNQYNELQSSKYKDDMRFTYNCIHENGFVGGTIVGGMSGCVLALIYPFPSMVLFSGSLLFMGIAGPNYLSSKLKEESSKK